MKALFTAILATCIALTNCSKSGSYTPPAPVTTKLKLTITDLTTGLKSAGASVVLYPTETDWDNRTNSVAAGTADSNGEITFDNLQSKKYYWYIANGCRSNQFEAKTTTGAIPANVTSTLNVVVNGTGGLGLANTSSNPYRVYVDGAVAINSMPGNSTAALKITTGFHTVRVLQLSGYLVTPTDQSYTGTWACGQTLTTTFP